MKIRVRMISFVIAFCMAIGFPSRAHAITLNEENALYESVIVLGNVTIAAYENDDGDAIVCEFVDGVLTQRNIIYNNWRGIVVCEYYNEFGFVKDTEHIKSADFIGTQRRDEATPYAATTYLPFGEIQYRVVGYEGYEYYN